MTGNVDADFTMTAAQQWALNGFVTVGAGNVLIESNEQMEDIIANGVTLTIEAGTDIRGLEQSTLLVTRGSRLIADGTATAPITFSSPDEDFSGEGEWGGLIIQGFAPQYGTGGAGECWEEGQNFCNVEGEGGTDVAEYGGNVMDDDSGIIRYVRIAEGGVTVGVDNEVNGLTLQGVGHGTVVEYVQVHSNLDDGIEWFGGNGQR